MRKRDFILFGTLLIIICFYLLETTVELYYLTEGQELKKHQEEIKKLEADNLILRQQVLEASSLRVIVERALKMGFKEPKTQDYYFID